MKDIRSHKYTRLFFSLFFLISGPLFLTGCGDSGNDGYSRRYSQANCRHLRGAEYQNCLSQNRYDYEWAGTLSVTGKDWYEDFLEQKRICNTPLTIAPNARCNDWSKDIHIEIHGEDTGRNIKAAVVLLAEQDRNWLGGGRLLDLTRFRACPSYEGSCLENSLVSYFRPANNNEDVVFRYGNFQVYVEDELGDNDLRVHVVLNGEEIASGRADLIYSRDDDPYYYDDYDPYYDDYDPYYDEYASY